jgi:hypothetical protein
MEKSRKCNATILWNQQPKTDRSTQSNKQDNIIRDNERGTFLLIDIAISGDRNGIKIEADKTVK